MLLIGGGIFNVLFFTFDYINYLCKDFRSLMMKKGYKYYLLSTIITQVKNNYMRKKIEKPEVKVLRLQEMNVIATSGGGDVPSTAKFTMESLTRGSDIDLIGWH